MKIIMINKVALMEAKNKIQSILIPENRTAIGVTKENQNQWNGSKIPEDLKNIIDEVYEKISEIATDNRISTMSVNKVIQNSRLEVSHIAEMSYKRKSIEQLGKIQGALNRMGQSLEKDENFEVENCKQDVNEEMKDDRNNTAIKEQLAKEMLGSIANIQKTINAELFIRGGSAAQIESSIQKITRSINSST